MKRLRVLVSGGTGFLGDQVRPLLSEFADVTLISRTRPGCLRADLSMWNGGIEPATLRGQFDVFLHMAGLYDLRVDRAEGFSQNIAGTHTALAIAQAAEIPHFIHISTVAVTMNEKRHRVSLSPDALSSLGSWPDAYGESKAHAEKLVRNWTAPTLHSRLILRLGILVGDSLEGRIQRIDGPYHAPERMKDLVSLLSSFPGPIPVPGRKDQTLPLVPVDAAARAIVNLMALSRKEKWEGIKSLYIVSDKGPTAEELFRSTLRRLGVERDVQILSALPDWLAKQGAELIAKLPRQELDYLLGFPRFDLQPTLDALGESWCPPFASYEDAFWRGYEAYVSNR
ncbi:MAG: SDR family oxidoreductase [Bdellovibrionota bacterium]